MMRFGWAGLAPGLALLLSGLATGQGDPRWADKFAEEATRDLVAGAPGSVSNRIAGINGELDSNLRQASRCELATAVEVQNLEMQLGSGPQIDVRKWFALPEGDLRYLEARAKPSKEAFEGVLEVDARHHEARRALATMAAEGGDWETARRSFEELVGEDPRDAETRHRFAVAARRNGDVDLALDQWAAALDANPGHAESWYGCGSLWLARGLFESAERAFRKAVDLDAIHWRAYEGLVQSLVGQRRYAEAEAPRRFLASRAAKLPRIGIRMALGSLVKDRRETIVWERFPELEPASDPWRFRIETFDQAAPGGKPIKITELRRDGEGWAWGDVDADEKFTATKTLKTLPELEQVLEEAK